MTKIRPDSIIMSSITPGFGYRGILYTDIVVSGTIPDGGKHFYGTITVPEDTFGIAFYKVTGSSIVTADDMMELGNGYSGVDNALSMTTYVFGSKHNTTYTIDVFINNYSGSSQTVPTQTVHIQLYTFVNPY